MLSKYSCKSKHISFSLSQDTVLFFIENTIILMINLLIKYVQLPTIKNRSKQMGMQINISKDKSQRDRDKQREGEGEERERITDLVTKYQ